MTERHATITGVADTPLGKLPGHSTLDLAVMAADAAVADAGLGWDAVDGLLTTPPLVGAFPRHAAVLAETLGISAQLRHAGTVSMGGASSLHALLTATELVRTRRCRAVLFAAADTPRTGQRRADSVGAFAAMRHPVWEQPYGLSNVSAYALLAQAYLWRHHLPDDALTSLPVPLRAHAQTNPSAVYRNRLSRDDVRFSRMVSSPLRLLECSPVCDGGAAFVVTDTATARPDMPDVALVAHGQAATFDSVSFGGDLSATGAELSAHRALQAWGHRPQDADVALLYDSYSITLAVLLEALGLCPPGAAAAFAGDGGLGLDGPLPVNPHGGLLSHAHCGGAAGVHHITEAVRQLRGTAANQVHDARTALLHAEGGILSTHATAVLQAA